MSHKKSTPEARKLLAKNIHRLRLERGWTQENLADNTGLHRTTISQLERGVVNVSIDKFDLLAEAFGIPLHRLFDIHMLATGRNKPKYPGVEEAQAQYGPARTSAARIGIVAT